MRQGDDVSNVIQIGDFSVAKKNSKYQYSQPKACRHLRVELDENGQIVECLDCGKQITPWFALMTLVEYFDKEQSAIKGKAARLAEDTEKKIHLLSARKVEKAWRSGMACCCPHCGKGITAKHGLGDSQVSAIFCK